MKEGSKYQPLLDFLYSSEQNEIILSFAEIERLIKESLPNSAKSKRAWWSNRSKGALQASAWIEAGYRVENVDFDQQCITFRQFTNSEEVQIVDGKVVWNSKSIKALRLQIGLTQAEFAQELGVRQQTVSEWENGIYEPTRSKSKHLDLVAKTIGFKYEVGS
ncbi:MULTISPECIES: DNA-binding transcriptional regulator [Aphanizomenonaceae]|jgi:DNA-binding transcriptional regulator YiaG|uniref:Helix-turn-helix transcriptional regulator n=1 Tax=Dolichospermum heterosporum TAC447 TaxID=747523 RepID=A0ABY5LTS4_9CYAN|nr:MULTISPECIES: helix-turn-helix transcriptional regulator [Aphanizomenonaceae]MDK2408575.1 helix-turn-helix transcriptional regulator [Aphanizomenon sp. 202]MDK2459423.1 helix-turn-helix transcriptional regulator [Aphanizomenon sp. PH219]MDM3846393.1 helix-turn-helix transcriptional regulator [Aphanizomenon gracile PMC638.10]MBE9251592.1 helix-turn-helix transcriptional regulator [Dolichospermum sp. LEGE 00240]MBE9255892.1 helix-turn-helix transcriptional regulator [Dolichospermum sp. LEGE 0